MHFSSADNNANVVRFRNAKDIPNKGTGRSDEMRTLCGTIIAAAVAYAALGGSLDEF